MMPVEQATEASPPPPPHMPTPPKLRRGTQTDVTSASVTSSPLPPMKEFKYEPPTEERVEENDEDDYDDDDSLVEHEAR